MVVLAAAVMGINHILYVGLETVNAMGSGTPVVLLLALPLILPVIILAPLIGTIIFNVMLANCYLRQRQSQLSARLSQRRSNLRAIEFLPRRLRSTPIHPVGHLPPSRGKAKILGFAGFAFPL
jgi:hypothetical protein